MKKLASILFIAGFLTGCATFPEPVNNTSTLVTGQIIHEAKNYEGGGYSLMSGIHKFGITLYVVNTDTGEVVILETNDEGIFYSTKFTEGQYAMRDIYVVVNRGSWIATQKVEMNTPNTPEMPKFFKVAGGKVNNIGSIYWESFFNEGIRFTMNKDYKLVQEYYKFRHPESKWLNREWIPVNIYK